VLRQKYDSKVNAAGVDRAVERATRVRAASDSANRAARPQTQVPIAPPGAPQGQQPPGAQPPAEEPPGAQPPQGAAPPPARQP
jgi:hypothetical protein